MGSFKDLINLDIVTDISNVTANLQKVRADFKKTEAVLSKAKPPSLLSEIKINNLQKAKKSIDKISNSLNFKPKLDSLNLALNKQGKIVDINTRKIVKYNNIVKRQIRLTDKLKFRFKTIAKQMNLTRGAMVGFGLSLLFGGMALKRFGQAGIRAIFGVFNNFDENQTKMQESLLQLSAGFEFLKFSIVNALEGTVIESFMLVVAESFVRLADFFSANPAWAVALIALFASLFGVGSSAILLGQVGLFLTSFIEIFEGLFNVSLYKIVRIGMIKFSTSLLGSLFITLVKFLAIWAALIAVLEFSGIETKWSTTLKGMRKGWGEMWNGMLTTDFGEVTTGIIRFMSNLGVLLLNTLSGISELLIELLLVDSFISPGFWYNLGVSAITGFKRGLRGGGITDILEGYRKDFTSRRAAWVEKINLPIFDEENFEQGNIKIDNLFRSTEVGYGNIEKEVKKQIAISKHLKEIGLEGYAPNKIIGETLDVFTTRGYVAKLSDVQKAYERLTSSLGDTEKLDDFNNLQEKFKNQLKSSGVEIDKLSGETFDNFVSTADEKLINSLDKVDEKMMKSVENTQEFSNKLSTLPSTFSASMGVTVTVIDKFKIGLDKIMTRMQESTDLIYYTFIPALARAEIQLLADGNATKNFNDELTALDGRSTSSTHTHTIITRRVSG